MSAIGAREAVGAAFSMPAMLRARERTIEAVNSIAAAIKPGLTEHQAGETARAMLEARGMDRIWHKNLVRFGSETLKTFHELSDPDRVLGEEDVFFVDLGVVWDGHEGDAGDTFVTGSDPEMRPAPRPPAICGRSSPRAGATSVHPARRSMPSPPNRPKRWDGA